MIRQDIKGKNMLSKVKNKDMGNEAFDVNDDKLKKFLGYLKIVKEDRFTGYLKINYSQGSIGRIEKFEEILKN